MPRAIAIFRAFMQDWMTRVGIAGTVAGVIGYYKGWTSTFITHTVTATAVVLLFFSVYKVWRNEQKKKLQPEEAPTTKAV